MKKIKVFNTSTCEYDTYKRNLCGRWTKVVKPVVCEPIVIPRCKPVVCEYVEYIYC